MKAMRNLSTCHMKKSGRHLRRSDCGFHCLPHAIAIRITSVVEDSLLIITWLR
jgi:hypothetical protein